MSAFMESHAHHLKVLSEHLADEVGEAVYPPGRRVQLSLAYYCIVLEHYRAVSQLLDARLYSSAFALARPLYEALVKGIWLHRCANDADLERYATGKELDQVGALTEELLQLEPSSLVSRQMRNIKQKYWKILSSLTHAGHHQVRRWLSPIGVEPMYEAGEIKELANFVGFMALSAGIEMARLSSNAGGVDRLSAMLPKEATQ